MVAAPPKAEAAAARPAAVRRPVTARRSPIVNGRPNHRSSSHAARTASPALQRLLNVAVRRLRSLTRLAARVPITKPITSAGYARRFEMIRKPTARPDAGQKTAAPEG